MRRDLITAFLLILACVPANAFGTDPKSNGLGSEHERITRAAVPDIEPVTLDRLAGKNGVVGAVGMSDQPQRGMPQYAALHCDGADYLAPPELGAAPYAQTFEVAKAALVACRSLIAGELALAVVAAKPLSEPGLDDTSLDCRFDGRGGSAKCNVLEHLGLAFHAAQDFYSRTNWVDRPAAGLIAPENPPGLGKSGRAAWLDPRRETPFPGGLISGCPGDLSLVGVTVGCEYGDWSPVFGQRRVMRVDLNKDTGPIGRSIGGEGTTPRGKINGNFARAVAAAIEDTRDKWAYFRDRVVATYGADAGATIICAMERDTFNRAACAKNIAQASVCTAREVQYVHHSDVSMEFIEPSEVELKAAEALWSTLRSYCRIEESDVARNAAIRGGEADRGRSLAKERAVKSLALWNACPVQARRAQTIAERDDKAAFLALRTTGSEAGERAGDILAAIYANCVLAERLRQLGH